MLEADFLLFFTSQNSGVIVITDYVLPEVYGYRSSDGLFKVMAAVPEMEGGSFCNELAL